MLFNPLLILKHFEIARLLIIITEEKYLKFKINVNVNNVKSFKSFSASGYIPPFIDVFGIIVDIYTFYECFKIFRAFQQ